MLNHIWFIPYGLPWISNCYVDSHMNHGFLCICGSSELLSLQKPLEIQRTCKNLNGLHGSKSILYISKNMQNMWRSIPTIELINAIGDALPASPRNIVCTRHGLKKYFQQFHDGSENTKGMILRMLTLK